MFSYSPLLKFAAVSLFVLLLFVVLVAPAPACCAAPPSGKPVVNADQTVIILWDAATKTEHLIRKASFKSDADEFGFLVPTPTQPELAEAGSAAFPFLFKLTEPEIIYQSWPSGLSCGCSINKAAMVERPRGGVEVLTEKEVAGFHAVVLATDSSEALVNWLKENGFAFSPEVSAWAKPYVEAGWKITALKVSKRQADHADKNVVASSLRISFRTDRPLFPYREPDSSTSVRALGAKDRLLRIYFLSDSSYQGELTKDTAWTGKVAWADDVAPEDRRRILQLLKLPEDTGPADWWLTEFEDHWPYRVAPADLYFSRAAQQAKVKRPPIIQYTVLPRDVTFYLLAAALAWLFLRRTRRRVAH
jgi:hypothetical protein